MSQTETPDLATGVYVDGEEVVAELRGRNSRKVHKPDPEKAEDDDPYPECAGKPSGYDVGSSHHEWKWRDRETAEVWRDPCLICFPNGGDK